MSLSEMRQSVSTYGWPAMMYDLFYQNINRFVYFKVLQGMTVTMESLDPIFLKENEKYNYRFLSEKELFEFAKNPKHQLTKSFIEQALLKNDHCFAILEGDKLASYGWYSSEPTNINSELILNFKNSYVYMYKGYTSDEYRGQRLHAIGMARALEAFTLKGFDGLISYVETNNYSSLKSVYRMGYKNIGRLMVTKVSGKYFIRCDEDCRAYQFNLTKMPKMIEA